jgi:hypothetical protein
MIRDASFHCWRDPQGLMQAGEVVSDHFASSSRHQPIVMLVTRRTMASGQF